MRIASLYRYPVKGLSPEPLLRAELTEGAYFPGDRLFAIENGPSGFEEADPVHQPKIKYLMLMRNEVLATLRTRFDDAGGELVISHEGEERLRADTASPEGREQIGAFFRAFMPDELRGEPKLLSAPGGYRFTDSRSGHVSLINLASVADLGQRMHMTLDPLRFRGNIMVEELPAWAELDLVGRRLTARSGLVLEIVKRIERCAATNVDPTTGARDAQIPRALMKSFGHVDCGIYARIVEGGSLAPGERLELAPAEAPRREAIV